MSDKAQYRIKSRDKMKTIDVVFVSDDLVGEIILPRKEYEKQQQRKLKDEAKEMTDVEVASPRAKKRKAEEYKKEETPKKPKEDDLELALAALENNDVKEETMRKPSTLFDEDADISAKKIYSFNSKKTYGTSPLAKRALINSANTTPNAKSLKRIEEETNPQTPYSLRKRVINDIKKIQKILENSDDERDFSPSGSEYDESSSSSSDMEDSSPKNKKTYFEVKNKACGRSLAKLSTPRLTREAVDKVFQNLTIDAIHKPQLTQLFRTQLALFEKWDYLLRHNYNILLYGVGSKKEIVEKFLSQYTNKYPVIKVNGFFPSVTATDVLERINDCLKIESFNWNADEIEAKLDQHNIEIYLGINNIDGLMLRSKKNQQVFARLATLSQIRLIATIDHINAPLLWDQCMLTDLNWVWMDATTFLPYAEETSYEGSILLHPSSQLTLASLRSVFNSLTRNARQLFLILAKAQASAEKGWLGMAFRELYHEGRRQLLVSTDSALRLQLKEFIDHAVVKQKRSPEGEEKYYIVMDNSIVKQFLDQQET